MRRNWLRGIAIALLLMPEPFTTPVGAVLLVVSFFLPKRHKDSLRNLEDLVRRYTQYKETTGLNRFALFTKPTEFHQLNRDIPYPQVNSTACSVRRSYNYYSRAPNVNRNRYTNPHVTAWHADIDKRTPAGFRHHYLTDSCRVNDKIIHHVLRPILPLYEFVPSKPVKIVHHTIKTTIQPPTQEVFHSSLRPIWPIPQVTVIHHSLKRS
jgi:hypothetical protein